jgi:hypothetical protein
VLDRGTERRRVHFHVQRAQDANLSATLTFNQWMRAIEYFGRLCAYCLFCRFEVLDHWVPIQDGGGTTVDNCLPACKKCNEVKVAYSPLRDDIACVLSRGAVFRALVYIAWVQTTPEDADVYAYVPGALASERAYSTASVEPFVRAIWHPGMSVNGLAPAAYISHSTASSWDRTLKMERDTLGSQQRQRLFVKAQSGPDLEPIQCTFVGQTKSAELITESALLSAISTVRARYRPAFSSVDTSRRSRSVGLVSILAPPTP